MQKYQKDFIENLKLHRKTNSLSQSQLAEFCNVATGTIGNIECGIAKPSFDLILKFAEIFKIHPAFLFLSETEIQEIAIKNTMFNDRTFILHLKEELNDYLRHP